MKKLLISGLVETSGVVVPKDSVAARGFFADLGRNTEIFGLGVAFLGLQITNLENRCVAMHGRPDQKRCFARWKQEKELRTTSTARYLTVV
jgi:hypothetical protein